MTLGFRIEKRGGHVDFGIFRGSHWVQPLQIWQGDSVSDITNWKPKIEVFDSPVRDIGNDELPIYILSLSNGRIKIASAEDGLIQTDLSPDETSELPFQTAYYRFSAVDGNDIDTTYLTGRLTVK